MKVSTWPNGNCSGSWVGGWRFPSGFLVSVDRAHPSRYPHVHATCHGPLLLPSHSSDLRFSHHFLQTAPFLSGLSAPVLTQPWSFTWTLVVAFSQLMPPLSKPSCHFSKMYTCFCYSLPSKSFSVSTAYEVQMTPYGVKGPAETVPGRHLSARHRDAFLSPWCAPSGTFTCQILIFKDWISWGGGVCEFPQGDTDSLLLPIHPLVFPCCSCNVSSRSSILLLKCKPLEGSAMVYSSLYAQCLHRAEHLIDNSLLSDNWTSIIRH